MTQEAQPTVDGLMALVEEYGRARWDSGAAEAVFDKLGANYSRTQSDKLLAEARSYASSLSSVGAAAQPVAYMVTFPDEPELGSYLTEERPDSMLGVIPLLAAPVSSPPSAGEAPMQAEPIPVQHTDPDKFPSKADVMRAHERAASPSAPAPQPEPNDTTKG